jgi:hypothetical protein
MEMKDYEFYVTLKDGKAFKVVQKGRTMSEAKASFRGTIFGCKNNYFN